MHRKFLSGFILILIFIPSFSEENTLKIFWPIALAPTDKFYDPAGYSFVEDWLILNNLYNGLIKLDNYQRILPDVADFWKISPDSLNYQFRLKNNIRFSNGKILEASDFLNSLERLYKIARKRDPVAKEFFSVLIGNENCSWDEVKKKVIIKSKFEIEINISKTYPFFLYLLANPALKIVYEDSNGKLYGTGPFVLEKIEERKVTLTKNPYHFEGAPLIDKIVLMDYLGIPVEQRFAIFKKGEVDIFFSPGNKFFKPSPNSSALEMEEELYSFTFLTLNLSIPPFNNKEFRKALFLGINKKKIAVELGNHGIYYPYAVPRKLHRYEVPLPYGEYNFSHAKNLIEKLKKEYKFKPIYIPFYSETPFNMKFLSLLKDELSKLGLEVRLMKTTEEEYWNMLENRKFQIMLQSYYADLPEAYGILHPLFYSKSPVNYSGYKNIEVDRLLHEVLKERNYSKRIEIYKEIEKHIYRDNPIIPLFTDKQILIVRDNIEGLQLSYSGLIDTDFRKVRFKK